MERPDYIILLLYFAGIIGLGFYYSAKNKDSSDMFAAGSESPWWVSGLSAFMTNFSAGTFVVWGAIAFKYGMVGVSINLCYGLAALTVGYTVAGRWKQLNVRTPAQYIELRFGPRSVQVYSFLLIAFRTIGTAVALYSLAVLVTALIPLVEGNLLRDPDTGLLAVSWCILLFGVIIVTYTMAGGLWAVLMTDVIQFVILNLAVILIVPLLIMKIGGIDAFVSIAPDNFFSLTVPEFGWFFLFGWYAIHFFMIGADWAFAQRFICVPTPRDARKSAYLFGALYLVSPVIWLLPPMLYRVIDPSADPEKAYILATSYVLPPGMIGLMVAAMFSATASLVSSHLNVFAGVLTDEFYRRLVFPEASNSHLLWMGRIFTLLIGATLTSIALAIPFLGGAEQVIITVVSLSAVPLLAPPVVGFFSKRITSGTLWLTMLISVPIAVVAKYTLTAGQLFVGVPFLGQLAEWAQSNSRTLDVITGVLIPIALLFFLHLLSVREAPGWVRVEHHTEQARRHTQPKASELPARVLTVAVAFCAVLLTGLAATASTDRLLLGVSAGVLMIVSALIYHGQKR